jgi:hypothetical protein
MVLSKREVFVTSYSVSLPDVVTVTLQAGRIRVVIVKGFIILAVNTASK